MAFGKQGSESAALNSATSHDRSMGKFFKQYGALPYRVRRGSVEVLLITSRETRRWIVPKGWPKKSARSTAKNEAYEESGVRGKVSARALGSFNYWKEIGARKIRCRLKVFALAVKTRAKKWPE